MKHAAISCAMSSAASLLFCGQAFAQASTIQPYGEWSISSDEESCTLERGFSAQSNGDTTVFIRSWGPGAPSRVSVAGPTMSRNDRAAIIADIGFGEEFDSRTIAIGSSYRDQPMIYFQAMLPMSSRHTGATALGFIFDSPSDPHIFIGLDFDATRLHIDLADKEPQVIETGDLAPALTMLDECQQQLVASWGYDPHAGDQLSQQPRLLNSSYVAQRFHRPDVYTTNHYSWIGNFRLVVNENGDVEDCVLQSPNFSRRSTRIACSRIAQVAEFEPALDLNGNPVSALYNASVMYAIFN